LRPKTKEREGIRHSVARNSRDLTGAIDLASKAFITAKRAKVYDVAVFPKHSMCFEPTRQWIDAAVQRLSRSQPILSDKAGTAAVGSTWERSEVNEGASIPFEDMSNEGILR
jgi:hypothetical protein